MTNKKNNTCNFIICKKKKLIRIKYLMLSPYSLLFSTSKIFTFFQYK